MIFPMMQRTLARGSARGLLILAASMLAVPALCAAEPALVEVKLPGIDYAARIADGFESTHTPVALAPVKVSFSRLWDPRSFGTFGLEAKEIDKIRNDLAALAEEIFVEAVRTAQLTTPTASDKKPRQLEIKIFDVYVNSPPRSGAEPLYSWVFDSGEMSIEVLLRDPETGETLAVLRDRQRDTGSGVLTLANEINQRAETRRVLKEWAKQTIRLLN